MLPPCLKTKDLTERKLVSTFRARQKSLEEGNKPLSGVFLCVFSHKILVIKVVYCRVNMFKPVMHSFCWMSFKHGVLKEFPFLAVNPRCAEQRQIACQSKSSYFFFLQLTGKLSSQVDKFLFRLQQASYNFKTPLKITVSEYPLVFPRSSGEHYHMARKAYKFYMYHVKYCVYVYVWYIKKEG